MDSGISKPVAGAAAVDPARALVSVPGAAPTELPKAKTVSAAVSAGSASNDPGSAAGAAAREFVLDPQTRELIYRLLDARSRQAIRQTPDGARSRVRAYARALANGRRGPESQHTDVTT